MKIAILGIGSTKCGELWDISPRTLVRQAVAEAVADARIKSGAIESLYVGNMLSGILGDQENLGAFYAEELNLAGIPSFKVEGACASGGVAVHNAINALLAGIYNVCLVIGVEKMTDHKPEEIAKALMAAGHDEERTAGTTFPGLYALLARAHIEKYGTKEEELAAVAVKNHFHASLNPKAQFQFPVTIKQVLQSAYVAKPLKLFDSCPISDGAAAVIIAHTESPFYARWLKKSKKRQPVFITASSVATDTLGLAKRKDLTTLAATQKAAQKAYQQAGMTPKQISVAEVHDCFTIAEILAVEDLGFFKKGQAAKAISQGATKLGDPQLVVNSSGGLKASGHPIGATGVKQIVEIVTQLRGEARKRQVKKAKVGLAHNVGGSGAVAAVHILQT